MAVFVWRPRVRELDSVMRTFWNWLRNPKNLAVLIALGTGIAFFWEKLDTDGVPPPTQKISAQPIENVEPSGRRFLPDEHVRAQITTALRDGDADRAISILRGLADGVVRREECERIYSFCIKNRKLDEARTVASHCWDGKRRQEAFAQIELEGLKDQ